MGKKIRSAVVCIFFAIISKWKMAIKLSWFVSSSREADGRKETRDLILLLLNSMRVYH